MDELTYISHQNQHLKPIMSQQQPTYMNCYEYSQFRQVASNLVAPPAPSAPPPPPPPPYQAPSQYENLYAKNAAAETSILTPPPYPPHPPPPPPTLPTQNFPFGVYPNYFFPPNSNYSNNISQSLNRSQFNEQSIRNCYQQQQQQQNNITIDESIIYENSAVNTSNIGFVNLKLYVKNRFYKMLKNKKP